MPNNTRTVLIAQAALVMLAGALFAFWPIKIQLSGTEGTCGLAAVAAFQYENSDPNNVGPGQSKTTLALEEQCNHIGMQHLVLGLAIIAAGASALGIIIAKLPPLLPWWDGQRWHT